MSYWLMKTEPESFSIDDLKSKGQEHWDGVRAYPARNNMQKMKKGDLVLFYHSSTKPAGVAGIARVSKEAYPDFTAQDPNSHYFDTRSTPDKPIWEMVDVEFVEKFPRVVTLDEIKADPDFAGMPLLTSFRLSVQPVESVHFEHIKQLGRSQ
jgi:predicted RNA-binding protein with PUA-like domain